MTRRGWFGVIAGMVLLWGAGPNTAVNAAKQGDTPGPVAYIEATGHNVREPFLSFWYAHGGEDVLGPPLTEAMAEGGATVQYFTNARLETQVLGNAGAASLGREASNGRTDAAFAPIALLPPDNAVRHSFTETHHTLANGIRRFWEAHDGGALLGPPLSEEFAQDGGTVQYFVLGALIWRADHADRADDVTMLPLGRAAFDARKYPTEWLGVAPSQATPPVAVHVPVLMYHHIGPASRYFTTAAQFTAQMDWLGANGYHPITVSHLYDAIYAGRALPDKPVAITWDDANIDQRLAFPILRDHGFVASYFIISGKHDLSDTELVDLIHGGNDVLSHTITHPHLPGVGNGVLANELTASKADLEARLGWPVRYLAYPYGESNGRVWAATQAAGYRGAMNATGGVASDPGQRWFASRIEIAGTLSLDAFAQYVTQ